MGKYPLQFEKLMFRKVQLVHDYEDVILVAMTSTSD